MSRYLHTTIGVRSFILVLVTVTVHITMTTAQETESYIEVGLIPSAVAVRPIGSITTINGSSPCADDFQAQTGINPGFSLWGSYVFDESTEMQSTGWRLRGVRLRADYLDLSSQYVATPAAMLSAYDDITDRFVAVDTRHTATYDLQYLLTAGDIEFQFGSAFLLQAGVTVALPLSGESSEEEEIVAPANATYLDKRQRHTIPEGTGTLNDLKLRLGLELALAYRLPLGTSLFFEPTIGADVGLSKIQPEWTPLLIRAGIGIGMAFKAAPPPPPVITVRDTVSPVPVPAEPSPFSGSVSVRAVTAGEQPIEFRREIIARFIPLLPTVFFDRNSSIVPDRYSLLEVGDTAKFSETSVTPNAEGAHHDVLNVIGERLRSRPRANVTIVGTTSRDEENRNALARERADVVANYFSQVWGIDKGRITTEARQSPQVRSNDEYEDGRAENRRVEIVFNDEELYSPIQLRVIEPVTEPQSIRFATQVSTSRPVERWEVEISGNTGFHRSLRGSGMVADTIRWDLTSDDRESVLTSSTMTYSLSVFDSLDRTLSTATLPLPVHRDTSISVSTSQAKPLDAAEFLLITFDFDRADLTPRGRSDLKAIALRIGSESDVVVTGYTDRLGDDAHNRSLAEARARGVAELLPKGVRIEVHGASPDEAPYSNELPEGRFLNRTVRVVVRNPR